MSIPRRSSPLFKPVTLLKHSEAAGLCRMLSSHKDALTGCFSYTVPTQGKTVKIAVIQNSSRGHSHLEDGVETGEGWLLSETPFPGELWSLSPLLLHDMFASPSNSCPDIILSISSSDICQIQDHYSYLAENRNKAEPLYVNTLAVQQHPELEPPAAGERLCHSCRSHIFPLHLPTSTRNSIYS